MFQLLRELVNDSRGGAAVEYGFMLAMIVLAMMGALSGFADESVAMWDEVSSKSAEAHGG